MSPQDLAEELLKQLLETITKDVCVHSPTLKPSMKQLQEVQRQFLEHPLRQSLINNLARIESMKMPSHIILIKSAP